MNLGLDMRNSDLSTSQTIAYVVGHDPISYKHYPQEISWLCSTQVNFYRFGLKLNSDKQTISTFGLKEESITISQAVFTIKEVIYYVSAFSNRSLCEYLKKPYPYKVIIILFLDSSSKIFFKSFKTFSFNRKTAG